jgi:membrane protease YdiL (CAAX protease family)
MSDFINNSDSEESGKNENQDLLNKFIPESPYPLISPVAAAFLGLIGGFVLYQFAGGLLTLLIFGFDIEAAPVNGLRLMTMAGQILFILLPALLFAKWIYGNISEVISLKLPNWKEVVLFTIGIVILTPLLQSYLYIQNFFIEQWAVNSEFINSIKSLSDSLNELIEKTFGNLLRADTIPEMLLVILVVSIIPAISEEFMFRGYIQRSFEFKLKPFRAALITAIFFSLYHFNPYGILPLAALGLYFGFAAYMSESLIIPIFLHFLNNFFAVMLYFTIGEDELITGNVMDAEALSSHLLFFFVLAGLFLLLIIFIRKYYLKTTTTSENENANLPKM